MADVLSQRRPGRAGIPRHDDDTIGDQRRPVCLLAPRMYVGPWLPEPVDISADPIFSDKKAEHYSLELTSTFRYLTRSSPTFFVTTGPKPSRNI